MSGIPAVSVLVGEVDACRRCWNGWTTAKGHRAIEVDASRTDLAAAAVTALWQSHDLISAAFGEVSRCTGREVPQLRAEWSVRTSAERSLWLDRVGLFDGPDDHDRLCRVLLTRTGTEARPPDPLVISQLGWPPTRLLRAICQLIPADELPAICFAWSGGSSVELSAIANELFEIASDTPRLPIALLLPSIAKAERLDREYSSRALAFLREGIIDVTASINGHSEPLANVTTSTAIAMVPEADELRRVQTDDEGARSAAERFLFEVLEATPDTTGLFALNVKLDFSFGGSQRAEIDLACAEFKLAIEIDGYYHFLDPDAYRRDRRKDLELQRRGWLVMRFLANDVGQRQEEIVATIRGAIEQRRETQR